MWIHGHSSSGVYGTLERLLSRPLVVMAQLLITQLLQEPPLTPATPSNPSPPPPLSPPAWLPVPLLSSPGRRPHTAAAASCGDCTGCNPAGRCGV
jgi:hypothetical protein